MGRLAAKVKAAANLMLQLTYSDMGIYSTMARATTTADVFNAIAEPRRREIIDALRGGQEHPVGELVTRLRLSQPAVSKHLGVLRKVGLVTVTKHGQQRWYRLDADKLKPLHDWVKTFENYWSHNIDRIKERAERKARETEARSAGPPPDPE